MATFLFLLAPVCLPCSARAATKDTAKVVEEYVISAKFDENKNLPQLNDGRLRKEETKSRSVPKEGSHLVPFSSGDLRDERHQFEDFEIGEGLEERDFLVHHQHLPPAPVPLAYAPSLFAVGLIVFLVLLNSLQTSFFLLKSKGSLLGSVTGALGRRKRFALENTDTFLENYFKRGFNATANTI